MNDTPAEFSQADIDRWTAEQARKADTRSAKRGGGMEWEDVLKIAHAMLPEEAPPLPYALTPEGQRMADFRKTCPAEFCQHPDKARLPDATAFFAVSQWQGAFPGPLAVGATQMAKTRAAWSALGALYVRGGKSFAWFPVKRLLTEFIKYESKDLADEFYRQYSRFDVLFVDDIDKVNWSFESETSALFQFYDWIYRNHRPCITTTNNTEAWWKKKMGDAFTRRLFQDAHFAVTFNPTKTA